MDFTFEIAELKGLLSALSYDEHQDTILQFMISEAIKTSEIEGEFFSRQDVMSSIKNHLGLGNNTHPVRDKKSIGVGKLMVEVRNTYQHKLSENLIKDWHKTLFGINPYINAGEYRSGDEPMQIVSGTIGKEIVHFEAPPANKLSIEMKNFINWYNNFDVKPADFKHALIKTSIAHLYFESIHPFEDGNGRIGRAIAEKCLSQSLNRPLLLSLSTKIEENKKLYYQSLKQAQKSLEITNWIYYFSKTIIEAQKNAKQIVLFSLKKSKFVDSCKNQLNERQLKAKLKMFEFGILGFEGGMTSQKYTSINKISRATATRDLQDLADKNILIQAGLGRNVKYGLNCIIA